MMSEFPPFGRSGLQGLPRAIDPGPLYKVHRRGRKAACFGNQSIFRFDPPVHRRDDFGALYAATSPASAFLETLGSIRPLPKHLIMERVITNLLVSHPFEIVDFTVASMIRAFGELLASKDFELTQNWAAALWDAGFTGIQYLPSYHSRRDETVVVLWAPPGVHEDLLKSDDPEQIGASLLNDVKSRFDIDVLDSGSLPWW